MRLKPSQFGQWADYYFAYQAALAREVLVPLLREWQLWRDGLRVLDVGCGQAGASDALAAAGAQVDGLEIDPRLLQEAERRVSAPSLRLFLGDITRGESLRPLRSSYDLVLFRDVLEHIPDVGLALRESTRLLGDDGRLLIIFPPWWSAFGGHQQTLPARRRLGVRWAKAPFAHCLGARWHRRLAGLAEDDAHWRELMTIRAAHLDLRRLQRLAAAAGLRRCARRDYLVRPSHRLRYGLPIVRAGWLGRVPLLNEALVNGSFQLFERLPPPPGATSLAEP
jgi:SAM-dependent methyltransferase